MTEDQSKYPIGKFSPHQSYSQLDIEARINDIRELPARVKLAVSNLSDKELDTPYREGGWTIRQVIHHLCDSHMNGLLRFKWALTEENTIVKSYEQQDWALLADYKLPVESSLNLLDSLHIHLVTLLVSLSDDNLSRTYGNSPSGERIPLKRAIALYAWHGKHHLAHIQNTFK